MKRAYKILDGKSISDIPFNTEPTLNHCKKNYINKFTSFEFATLAKVLERICRRLQDKLGLMFLENTGGPVNYISLERVKPFRILHLIAGGIWSEKHSVHKRGALELGNSHVYFVFHRSSLKLVYQNLLEVYSVRGVRFQCIRVNAMQYFGLHYVQRPYSVNKTHSSLAL